VKVQAAEGGREKVPSRRVSNLRLEEKKRKRWGRSYKNIHIKKESLQITVGEKTNFLFRISKGRKALASYQ